jgi:hypothetical protein
MSNQSVQTMVRKSGLTIEAVIDRLGMVLLLSLGVATAGATMLVRF